MSETTDQWCGKCKHYQRREPIGVGQTGDCTVTFGPVPDCFKRRVVFACFGAHCPCFEPAEKVTTT